MAKNKDVYFTPLNKQGTDSPAVQMDPRLQKAIAFRQNGMIKKATSSTSKDEVAVIAKITNLESWLSMTEIRSGNVITQDTGSMIVTARIPISRIEFIRQQPFVISMKAAQKVTRSLNATIAETGVNQVPAGTWKAKRGKGVIVGIVDFGCDFAHKNFQNGSKTRIKKLWDQNGSRGNSPAGYGSVFTEAELNTALTRANPYTALGYIPETQAHGTHVMDIAAGNGKGSGVAGMASDAEIIFVELNGSDVPWEGPEVVEKSFGDSVQLIEAIRFIFDEAGNKPCLINVSLGTNGGPHDGSTLVEEAIDRMTEEKPNRAVVLAASNSYVDGIHASGNVQSNQTYDLKWKVETNDNTDNEIEIWYGNTTLLQIEIMDPQGNSLGTVAPGESGTVRENGTVILFVANRLNDPNNGDNVIGVFMASGRSGVWNLRLTNVGNVDVGFHAWIERDDYGQSSFLEPHDNDFTLGSISCGKNTISVGSYDAHRAGTPLSYFSSAGPTRDNRQKPEISAPGHGVIAAKSRTVTGVMSMSGTSMAAPAVTGALAVFMAELNARNINSSITQIRNALIQCARTTPPPAGAWDHRYGFGRLSVQNLLAQLPASLSAPKKKRKKKPTKTPKRTPKKTAKRR